MRWFFVALLMGMAPAAAATCEDVRFEDNSFTACTVDAAQENLRLYHTDESGSVLGSFGAIAALPDVRSLVFAMNAGMYHDDRAPVGHYVQDGIEKMRLVTNAGPGNFGLLPNGVFCINDDSAQIFETLDYLERAPVCRDATQSGPMLVIDGALHPRFLPDSTSRFIRNGVGTTSDGSKAVFVISNTSVTFHEFGRFFLDYLQLPNALYFDGKVSRLYAKSLGRSDFGFQLGPMVAVTE